jgi:hypothetical protein
MTLIGRCCCETKECTTIGVWQGTDVSSLRSFPSGFRRRTIRDNWKPSDLDDVAVFIFGLNNSGGVAVPPLSLCVQLGLTTATILCLIKPGTASGVSGTLNRDQCNELNIAIGHLQNKSVELPRLRVSPDNEYTPLAAETEFEIPSANRNLLFEDVEKIWVNRPVRIRPKGSGLGRRSWMPEVYSPGSVPADDYWQSFIIAWTRPSIYTFENDQKFLMCDHSVFTLPQNDDTDDTGNETLWENIFKNAVKCDFSIACGSLGGALCLTNRQPAYFTVDLPSAVSYSGIDDYDVTVGPWQYTRPGEPVFPNLPVNGISEVHASGKHYVPPRPLPASHKVYIKTNTALGLYYGGGASCTYDHWDGYMAGWTVEPFDTFDIANDWAPGSCPKSHTLNWTQDFTSSPDKGNIGSANYRDDLFPPLGPYAQGGGGVSAANSIPASNLGPDYPSPPETFGEVLAYDCKPDRLQHNKYHTGFIGWRTLIEFYSWNNTIRVTIQAFCGLWAQWRYQSVLTSRFGVNSQAAVGGFSGQSQHIIPEPINHADSGTTWQDEMDSITGDSRSSPYMIYEVARQNDDQVFCDEEGKSIPIVLSQTNSVGGLTPQYFPDYITLTPGWD